MFGDLISPSRRRLRPGVAGGHSGIISMPVKEMRRRQYQAVIAIFRLGDQVLDEETE
jgi:hypothetical protein